MPLVIEPDPERDALFVKNYIRSRDAVDACAKARVFCVGYDMRDVAAHQLAKPHIKKMIAEAEVKATNDPSPEITRDSIITDLEQVFEKSMRDGEYTPAITAKKTQAQLLGWLENTVNVNIKRDIASMTDAELMQIIESKSSSQKVIDGEFTETKPLGIGHLRGESV